ncbi:MAG: hypothetical protein ACR2N4_13690 [Jatrophihabitans sp.]
MTVPRVFGLPHLSEDAVAAFADGVLSAPAASRARRHCAECTECTEAVRGQRETAMLLRAASAPSLPAGLLDRLAGVPMSASLPPPRGGLPTMLGEDGVPVFIAYQPVSKSPVERDEPDQRDEPRAHPHHRRVLLPVSIFASAAAVAAAGTLGTSVASLQPAVDQPASANFASNLVSNNAAGAAGQQFGAAFDVPSRLQTSVALAQQSVLRTAPILDRRHPTP